MIGPIDLQVDIHSSIPPNCLVNNFVVHCVKYHLDKVDDVLFNQTSICVFSSPSLFYYILLSPIGTGWIAVHYPLHLTKLLVIFVQIFLSHSQFRHFAPPSRLFSLSHHDQASLLAYDLPSVPVLLAFLLS